MHRRQFPSILLYGFGMALVVSLAFNGFLMFQQQHRISIHEYEAGTSVDLADQGIWQQQLSDCRQASQLKDSVIYHLKQISNLPPSGAVVKHTASK